MGVIGRITRQSQTVLPTKVLTGEYTRVPTLELEWIGIRNEF